MNTLAANPMPPAPTVQVATDPMRVLFCSSLFPRPHATTFAVYNLHLCRALVECGHAVHIFSPLSWLDRGRATTANVDAFAPVRRLFSAVEYPRYFYTPYLLRPAYGWFMWRSVQRKLQDVLQSFKPQFVLSYWAHPDGAVAARAAQLIGVPSAVIIGGSDVLILPRESAARRKRIVDALSTTDAVITVSQHLRQAVIDLGIPGEKVHVMYQGVDKSIFFPGDPVAPRQHLQLPLDKKILLFVGNLVQVKGLEVLLSAAATVKKHRTDFQLCIIGQGPLRTELEQTAIRLGLSDHVNFIGAVPQGKLGDWYRASDLVVMSSHSEGIPNALREANACGTPFVATRVGGIAEIAYEPENRLVPPKDPQSLADAIIEMLHRPSTQVPARHIGTWIDSARQVAGIARSLTSRRNA